jgi:hypothetical protein
MRDINRIPIILEKLKEAWLYMPDMRLCQMLYMLTREEMKNRSDKNDLFYVEDDIILEALEEYIKRP